MENVLSQQFMYCLISIYESFSSHRNFRFYRNLLCNVLFVNYTIWLLRLNTYSLLLGNMNMYGSCAGYFSISSYFSSALSFLAVFCTAAKSMLTKHHSTIPVKIGIWEMADICNTKFNGASSDNCFGLPFMCGVWQSREKADKLFPVCMKIWSVQPGELRWCRFWMSHMRFPILLTEMVGSLVYVGYYLLVFSVKLPAPTVHRGSHLCPWKHILLPSMCTCGQQWSPKLSKFSTPHCSYGSISSPESLDRVPAKLKALGINGGPSASSCCWSPLTLLVPSWPLRGSSLLVHPRCLSGSLLDSGKQEDL